MFDTFDHAPLALVVLIFTALITGLLGSATKNKNLRLMCLPLVWGQGLLILILRDFSAGVDYANYIRMYNQSETIAKALSIYHGDIFFSLAMRVGHFLNFDMNQFLVFFSAVLLFLIAYGYYLILPRYAPLALALFFTTSTFVFFNVNILRQGLAVAFFIVTLGLWLKRRRFISSVGAGSAFLTHSRSAFIAISAMVFGILSKAKIRISSRHYLAIVFALVASSFFVLKDLAVIAKLSSTLVNYLGREAGGVSGYVTYAKAGVLIAVFILILPLQKYLKHNLPDLVLFTYITITAVSLVMLPLTLMGANRMIYIASVFLPLIFSSLCSIRAKMHAKGMVFISVLSGGFAYSIFTYSFPSVIQQIGFTVLPFFP